MVHSNMMKSSTTLIAFLAVLMSAGLAEIRAAQSSVIGKKIDGFRLSDVRGQALSLDDLNDASAVVVAFLGTECPLANVDAPGFKKWRTIGVIRAFASSW